MFATGPASGVGGGGGEVKARVVQLCGGEGEDTNGMPARQAEVRAYIRTYTY
jgi:hypothetical protein